jgi:hypothetical protein
MAIIMSNAEMRSGERIRKKALMEVAARIP